ncbi:MAG: hypothetical protein K2X74_12520 [Acetobacteraceae bacterium]|nr:hypothetical protein [Acetobacteraceae bacterium]
MTDFAMFLDLCASEAEQPVLRNFHPIEPGGFAWSAGRWCELEFVCGAPGATDAAAERALVLDLDVFRHPPLLPSQDVLLYLNGLRLGAVTIRRRQTASFRLLDNALQPGVNRLTIDTPDASRPSEFGQPDTRLLGVQLFSLALRAFAGAAAEQPRIAPAAPGRTGETVSRVIARAPSMVGRNGVRVTLPGVGERHDAEDRARSR